MAIQIVSHKNEDSCYAVQVISQGNTYRTWLTYELHPTMPEERSLLLIKGTIDFLEEDERKAYQDLFNCLKTGVGERTEHTKSIVNLLVGGQVKLKGVRIAVHKFGPVPVYIPNKSYDIQLKSQHENVKHLKVQLALYPTMPYVLPKKHGEKGSRNQHEFMNSSSEYIKSLQIGFGRIMQRYLEDVAEDFFDIEHHLGLRRVLQRGKQAETTLTESIKAKLVKALISPRILEHYRKCNGETNDNVINSACKLFEENTNWVLTAAFARIYAQFFLNALYEQVGIESRVQQYREDLARLEGEFDARIHPGSFQDAVEDKLPDLATLLRAIKAYDSWDTSELENLHANALWAQGFVNFARFISGLRAFAREFSLTPQKCRIFISHHHNVPSTEVLKSQLTNWVDREAKETLSLLQFKTNAGPSIRPSISKLIWLSDTVNAIVPTKPVPISTGSSTKSYEWIAIEAEHGLLLNKRVRYLVEDNTSKENVIDGFKQMSEEFLAPAPALSRETRIQRLIESFQDHVFTPFTVQNMNVSAEALDSRVSQGFKEEIKQATRFRHQELVTGFVERFPGEVQSTLARLQCLVPYPKKGPKSWLGVHLKKNWPRVYRNEEYAKQAVTRAWAAAKKQALSINGKSHYLLKLNNNRYYSGMLHRILEALMPKATQIEIAEFERIVIERILPS
jgi:hypothetical protein